MRLAILGLALALLAQHATAINFCPFINPIIPKACTHDAACDSVTCDVTIGRYFDLSAAVQLNLCQAPASLDLSLGIEKPVHLTWSHDWSLGTTESIPIPGLSLKVDVFELGLVADVSFGGSLADLSISVALDICATIPFDEQEAKQLQLANNGTLAQPESKTVCGEDVAKYIPDLKGVLPYTVWSGSVKLPGNICG